MRRRFVKFAIASIAVNVLLGFLVPWVWYSMLLLGPIIVMGGIDYNQKKHAVRRNFPFLGRFRYWFEMIRPEIHQYFVESDESGRPFTREQRSVVYQRAKGVIDTLPFGTTIDTNRIGYEFVTQSLAPTHITSEQLRVTIGSSQCQQKYHASVLNISAMSYGSLSRNAIMALNKGAALGHFYHNTGEGGISPWHLKGDGDLVWQIGTGYFGCRTPEGKFDPTKFADSAQRPQVKMIEIKLSQGAKPAHGGILPARKLTPEIAQIRGVPLGQDVNSPPAHSRFDSPSGLMHFVGELRELSGGKPIGIKLNIGRKREFMAILKAVRSTNIMLDFVSVDGGEGGTGAAPLEFSNHIGTPLTDSLIFVHNTLVGFNLRSETKIIASGRIVTAFDIVRRLCIGADITNSARAMMMSLGCIQALKCNTNECPVGVATQNPELTTGLVVNEKDKRVANFHKETVESAADIMSAIGVQQMSDLAPFHLKRRTAISVIKHYGQLYQFVEPGSMLQEPYPDEFKSPLQGATPDSFQHVDDLINSKEST